VSDNLIHCKRCDGTRFLLSPDGVSAWTAICENCHCEYEPAWGMLLLLRDPAQEQTAGGQGPAPLSPHVRTS
jgi:hypothetical protein